MKFFAGLEAHSFAGRDADFGAGAGIAPNARLPRADIEDAKAAQLDALTLGERALEGLEDGIDGSLGFVPLQAGTLNYLVNDVLLYQGFLPSTQESLSRVIVEIFDGIVNAARLP